MDVLKPGIEPSGQVQGESLVYARNSAGAVRQSAT